MAPIVVGYWKIRGLAQPIRMVLGYNKADFVDELYEVGDAPTYDRSVWFNVKETLGLDFPNLPYLVDGDVKISQSNAILRYLARKFKMDVETEEQRIRLDVLENQAMDFRNGFVRLVYFSKPDDFAQKSEDYKKNIQGVLAKFDKCLGVKNKFFVGDKLTFVDFVLYELLDQHRLFADGILETYDNLKNFMKSFEAVPEIKEFMESEQCFKGDINNKMALFK